MFPAAVRKGAREFRTLARQPARGVRTAVVRLGDAMGATVAIQSVRSACTAMRTALCQDAHQGNAAVESFCRENVQQMCRLLECGGDMVATDFRVIAEVHA